MNKKATNLMSGGEEKDMSVIMYCTGPYHEPYIGWSSWWEEDGRGCSLNRIPYWYNDYKDQCTLDEVSSGPSNEFNVGIAIPNAYSDAKPEKNVTVTVEFEGTIIGIGTVNINDYDNRYVTTDTDSDWGNVYYEYVTLTFTPPQTDSYKFGKRRFLCGGGVNGQESCFDDVSRGKGESRGDVDNTLPQCRQRLLRSIFFRWVFAMGSNLQYGRRVSIQKALPRICSFDRILSLRRNFCEYPNRGSRRQSLLLHNRQEQELGSGAQLRHPLAYGNGGDNVQ